MKSMKAEIKRGVVVTFISRYSTIFFQIGFTSIFARLLSPKEFGIVAVVTVFITFFSLLSEMGIGVGIIQNKTLDEKDISSLFNFTVLIAIFSGIAFYGFSYLISRFYNNNVYIKIGHLLSIVVIFFSLSIVPLSILRKKQQFLKIGIIQISTLILSGTLGVILAIKGYSYYAIIFQSIVNSVLLFIGYLIFSRIKLNFIFQLKSIKKIFKYSFFQFLFNFINYFSRNLDNILIGKFLGPAALGYYDKAYKLMLYPVQNLTGVISSVIHPVMSSYQDKKDVIYYNYLKIINILLIIGLPISILFFFSANEIILIVFGTNWDQSIPVFKILSLAVWIQVVLSSTGSIYQAAGRTDLLFVSGIMSNILMISGMIIGMHYGIVGVAIGIVCAFYIMFIPAYLILIKFALKQSMKDFLKLFPRVIILSVILIIILNLCELFFLNKIDNIFISLGIKMCISSIVFIFWGIIFKESTILKLVKKKID